MDNNGRRKVQIVGIVVALAMNFGGVVWGVATISSAVRDLERTTTRLDGTLDRVQVQQNENVSMLRVLEEFRIRMERTHEPREREREREP